MTPEVEKILVVDYVEEDRFLIATLLRKYGYEVIEAEDGYDALKKLEEQPVVLVVSDLKMPKMDGIELLKEIKNKYPDIPFIILSAYSDLDVMYEALREGANAYFVKPVVPEVVEKISQYIAQIKSQGMLFPLNLKEFCPLCEIMPTPRGKINAVELMKKILEKAAKIVSADSGSIMIFNKDTRELELVVSIGLGEEITKVINLGERIAGRVCMEKKPVILYDGLEKYPEFAHLPTRPEILSSLSIPLVFKDEVLGVMNLNRLNKAQYRFTFFDLCELEFFTSYASSLIMQLSAHQKEMEMEYLKMSFLSYLSHEIRTPLMSISASAEYLEKKASQYDREIIEALIRNVKRLNMLVDNLLKFSALEAKSFKYNFVPTDIVSLIEELEEDFKEIFMSGHINFNVKIPEELQTQGLEIEIDRERIYEALSNLLSNALKFTSEGGNVVLSLSVNDVDTRTGAQKEVVISVEDTGKGIPQEYIDKIFDRFYQIDSFSTREFSGVGIGLAIVKDIVEAHKGKVWCESQPGQGSKFYIAIPLTTASLDKT
jgi:signal transduction histidine kinase/ActR/RegA family two-component response regulator